MQLGKLRGRLRDLHQIGAEVLAISNDDLDDAQRMTAELMGSIPVLSDPSMRVIYRYGMKGQGMPMAAMGYVVIDAKGVVRARAIDGRFGERVDAMIAALRGTAADVGVDRPRLHPSRPRRLVGSTRDPAGVR